MKQKIILLLWLFVPLFCLAQQGLKVQFDYDASGNRTARKVINMQLAPPAPPDSLVVTSDELPVSEHGTRNTEHESRQSENTYFIEKIGQVEMKIYPNPTTEKITLEIVGQVETHGRASLQLFTMNGQLLQTRLLSEAEVVVSLAGLPKGAYILKVRINDSVEDWKIIKQ
jgi:hypothetical protein